MEAFEHLAKVALEAEGFIVTNGLKFFVKRKTRKHGRAEFQTHGYEIDLVGAKQNRLVLASVKSFLGSKGVNRQGFQGIAASNSKDLHLYKLFNEEDLRHDVIQEAAKQFGYRPHDIELRLYVGRFKPSDEEIIRRHLTAIRAGAGSVRVVGLHELLERLLPLAESKTYYNDPVIMTLKVLKAEGFLRIPNQTS